MVILQPSKNWGQGTRVGQEDTLPCPFGQATWDRLRAARDAGRQREAGVVGRSWEQPVEVAVDTLGVISPNTFTRAALLPG